MTRGRLAALGLGALVLLFVLEGGEYGTRDLLVLRSKERTARERVAALKRSVDSLERALRAIEQDPRERERIARERFGMIRRGEFLYLLQEEDDTAAARPR